MKNRLTRMLSFLLIVATLCSLLGVFAAAESAVDPSVKMFYNRSFNEGWDCSNGMSIGSGITPFINHEYDDDFNYNYFAEFTEKEDSLAGGKATMTIPNSYIPTTGKTVLSFALKLPADSNQEYGTIVSGKTKPGASYNFLAVKGGQLFCLDTLIGAPKNDEWIRIQLVMSWADTVRSCAVTVQGGGISVNTTIPLLDGQSGASLQYVYFGMDSRASNTMNRTYLVDDLVFYNTAQELIAKEDLSLYGVGSLVKETIAKTVEIYGETVLAPTDYIKKGLTMKVNVNWYMTEVVVDEVRGTTAHKKQNIYTADNGDPYGAPVKIDGVVYVPLELILYHLGYQDSFKIREKSIEISTGGTTSVCITLGEKSASVNNQRVELSGAPGYATSVIEGKEYSYIVIPLDSVETFFAQEGAENPLYVTYDEMGLIFLCGKKNVWNRSENLTDMAVLMEKFIFDYDYDNKGVGFGERLVKDMEKYTGFQHPYLFANQDRWDTLRAVWMSNDQAAYDKLMALSDAEKADLGIAGADPKGYSETLRDWVRRWIYINVNDPAYILANGEWTASEDTEADTAYLAQMRITRAEKMYAANSDWLILDENGTYLGMNPGCGKIGYFSYRGGLVNRQLIKNGGNYDDGYDAGGRFSLNTGSIQTWARSYQITRDLRYAQITFDWISILGDTTIWEHWGPTHFLNTADGTTTVAIAYDWLCPAWDALVEKNIARPTAYTEVYKVYEGKTTNVLYYLTTEQYNALGLPTPSEKTIVRKYVDEATGAVSFVSEEKALTGTQIESGVANRLVMTPPSFPGVKTYDRKHLADIIMSQGVHEGWLAEARDMTEHPSVRCLGGFEWKSNTDNWNAVCTKGMALGALMTLEYEEHRAETIEMVDIMMYYFFVNGLDEYAPDGSYYESAGYWSYGTNAAFQLAAAYVSATGKDYGIMDSYGFDRTCYYAANVESSDAQIWSYNDCGGGGNAPNQGGMDTDWFIWVGKYTGDQGLIDHRMYQIENGLKNPSIYDVFYYEAEYSGVENIDLPLSYYMEGLKNYCGAYSVRSSWEKGAMCMSIIGGTNAVAHADVDAGAFMYWNAGKTWIWDLGADNYNLTSFFGSGYSGTNLPNRFRYYRHGAEGNNCVVLASHQDVLPFGQRVNGVAPLATQYADEYGAYAVYDMLDIYSSDPELAGTKSPLVSAAQRGVLATDDYQTAIIQDQIVATKLETFYWFAHFSEYTIQATLSDNGRVCYMKYKTPDRDENGDPYYVILRLTIVSPDSSDKFYITDAGDDAMVFDATFRYGTHQNYPDQLESPRTYVRRLTIKRELKSNCRLAVVFEILPAAFYNTRTGIIDIAGGQDTYPCSYKWTEMYNWQPKAAEDQDFGTGEEEDKKDEESLSIIDLETYSLEIQNYVKAGTAFGANFYECFAALSNMQKIWDLWGNSSMIGDFAESYKKCEVQINAYRRVQTQLNQTSATAQKMGSVLSGKR